MVVLLRLVFAVVVGGFFTTGVFFVLSELVRTPGDFSQLAEATRINFSRMRRDTPVATKRDEKVERQRPVATPEVPKMSFSAGGVESNITQLSPSLDVHGLMSRMTMVAGSDRDVLPLVRIAPDYPPRALSRGLEGWVQVRFTITATGTVKDPVVVAADPKDVFDDAALRAIARWRYNPRIEGGGAVARVGVETIIRFQLQD